MKSRSTASSAWWTMLRSSTALIRLTNRPTKPKYLNCLTSTPNLVKLPRISTSPTSKKDMPFPTKRYLGRSMSLKRESRYFLCNSGTTGQINLHLYASHGYLYRSDWGFEHGFGQSSNWLAERPSWKVADYLEEGLSKVGPRVHWQIYNVLQVVSDF